MYNKQTLIRDYLKELEDNNVAIFAGAGLSVSSGYVNWKGLIKEFADELGLNIEREIDLISLIQYSINENPANLHKLNQKIFNEFNLKDNYPNANHKILARLPISTYWTTNYDKLIEKAIESEGKIVDVKHEIGQMNYTKHKRDAVVYKMHGDCDHPHETVILKDDYESYFKKREPFINLLSSDLITKTFLFLGFSFTDPNVDYILSRIRVTFNKKQRSHYCIMKKLSLVDCDDKEDFLYKEIKQNLFINDLKRFHINTILVEKYSDISEILTEIEEKYKQNTVFISGSANEYGNWGREKSEDFISKISKSLIKKNYKIVSGFGLGVGSAVIGGVLEEIYMQKKHNLKNELLLRPFPQGEQDKHQWTKYREDMISYAGIAIFILGNKIVDNKLKLANGLKEEFEIAKKQKLILIPIGATGYMAEELWKEIMSDFDSFFPNNSIMKEYYTELGDKSKNPDELLVIINNILKILKEN